MCAHVHSLVTHDYAFFWLTHPFKCSGRDGQLLGHVFVWHPGVAGGVKLLCVQSRVLHRFGCTLESSADFVSFAIMEQLVGGYVQDYQNRFSYLRALKNWLIVFQMQMHPLFMWQAMMTGGN